MCSCEGAKSKDRSEGDANRVFSYGISLINNKLNRLITWSISLLPLLYTAAKFH